MRGAALALVLAGVVVGAGCSRTDLGQPDAAPLPPARDGSPDAPRDAARDAAPAVVEPLCIEVPADGTPVRAAFSLPVSLVVVDLLFLLDATGSMADEIDNVRNRLRSRVVPGVREAIPDAAFGVALLGEFPVSPHGPSDVRPYELRLPVTRDVLQVESALERVPEWGNFDEPEAQVEALYQVATGEGLAPWIPSSIGCPAGGTGGVCFRAEALPVVLLITDAPFHDGPPGVDPEAPYDLTPSPHSYDEMVREVRSVGALVIGLGATDADAFSPMAHLRALARDTGTLADGQPLVFDIGSTGTGVGQGIVDAVRRLAAAVPLDVTAEVRDVPGDELDARERVVAVRATSADPADGVGAVGEDRFLGVLPGTEVTFEIEVTAAGLDPAGDLRIPAEVVFRAFDRSRLGVQPIELAIGAGRVCP